jgi:hypothetical protein
LLDECQLRGTSPSFTMPASFFGRDPVQFFFLRVIPFAKAGDVARLLC